jgi:hypothetical protein
MELNAGIPMPRRSPIQKQQGILPPDRIGVLDFSKQLACVSELRFKLAKYLVADLKAAALNAGPDHGMEILRP